MFWRLLRSGRNGFAIVGAILLAVMPSLRKINPRRPAIRQYR